MHGMHARLPKHFVLEERLERYADFIELDPCALAGRWAEACSPIDGEGTTAFEEVRLDLGCGKGAFLVESAQRNPSVLYVGMDAEPLCIAYTAQHIAEAGVRNAVVVPAKGSLARSAFGPGELACIHINFPTPYPRKKEASKRLVALERLIEYREVLSEDGTVRLRTDSQPLRDFALTQFELAGYEVLWVTDDERAERPDDPTSEYEDRLTAQGAHVYGVWAKPAQKPIHTEQTASLSLVDYLPDDLFGDGDVPYGMNGTIVNLRNRAIRQR
jgi:tRNA (guanine-N7-)-methyltransferase